MSRRYPAVPSRGAPAAAPRSGGALRAAVALVVLAGLVGAGAGTASARLADLAVTAHARKAVELAPCSGVSCPARTVQLRVVVRNLGPDRARDLVVRLGRLDGRSTLGSVDCAAGAPVGRVGCGFRRLAAGASVAVRFRLDLCCPSGAADDAVVHSARAVSDTADPRRANNAATSRTALLVEPIRCGAVLVRDTTLSGDVSACPGDGLVIGASRITVSLAGHAVTGTGAAGGVGVRNAGFDGVRVVGGTIADFETGIALSGGADGNLLRLLSVRSGADGIVVADSGGARIEDVTVGSGGHAVLLLRSIGSLVEGGGLNANDLAAGPSAELANVALVDSDRNRILGNDMSASSATGILLRGSDRNRIERNRAGALGSDGNSGNGIALLDSDDNRVSGNTAASNVLDGVFVAAGSRRNRVSGNVASHNRDDGIDAQDPTTVILDNVADENGDLGIEAVPGVTGRRNQARGNGNPLQCLNVACTRPPRPEPVPPVNALGEPRGVAVDAAGRTLVAEAALGRIAVFGADRSGLTTFGAPGTGEGEFRQPWDLSVDPGGAIHVVDRGNGRVQVLDAAGAFVRQIGAPGAAPGQLADPQGVAIDALGRVYVADTGNHRVQRFLPEGALDPDWGAGGVVGASGEARRDHAGFDGPTDVAVDPATGRVHVADRGNARIEVLDDRGGYLRTHLAVFRANALAFDAAGNLYIAGEDPNEGYRAFDGRLRVLRPGEELIGAHYTGGLDDIGRVEGGVAVRPDGRIVFTDVLNGRLVETDAALSAPVSDLRIDARGTTVIFRWRTARAAAARVRLGPTGDADGVVTDDTVGTDHEVAVTGLDPGARLFYAVSFPDSFDGAERFTPTDVLNTGAPAGRAQFLRLKAVGLIYTDVDGGPGQARMDDARLAAARTRFRRVADFYWRNSGFRLWPDIRVVEVDRDLVGSLDLFAQAESDLAQLGFSAADDLDAVWGASPLMVGNFGGAGAVFGRSVGLAEWSTEDDFVAIHEVNHSIDSIYAFNDLGKYEFNHGIWAVPGGVGRDFAVNAQIVRNMLPVNFTAVRAPFAKVLTAPDADGDAVPDASPAGLTTALSITEATLGSSAAAADTDADGAGDLAEALALPFHGTDPTVPDSDGDGLADGADRNPAYRMDDRIARGTPVIDGVIDGAEGWTVMTNGFGFSNDALVPDSDAHQARVTTYAAWDERFLYLALRGPEGMTEVRLDGNADNMFFGPDNYSLRLGAGVSSKEVRVNVGVPDLFRQIDDDGQFSEFFDTDPKFTLSYAGRPFFDRAGEGAGFPGRLVTEDDLPYRSGGGGDAAVWEVAIPWSSATQLRPGEGRELAIAFDVGGDLLFETDHAARARLVGGR
jgi:parallel beta-helix repeat protein